MMDPYEEVAMLSHIVYPFSDIFIDTLNRIGKGTLKGDPKLLELYRKLQNVLEVVNGDAVSNGNDVPNSNDAPNSNTVSDEFQQLRAAITEGRARWKFPVGTLLPDIWTDPETGIQYRMPHRVMGYKVVQLADGRKPLGAILCRANTLPKEREFDKESNSFAESSLWRYLNLDTKDGYLAGCSKELRNAMAEVEVGETHGDDSFKVRCKVFVPSTEEVGVRYRYDMPPTTFTDYSLELFCWQYFHNTPDCWCEKSIKRVFCDLKGEPRHVMLRSDNRCGSIACVRIDGDVVGAKPEYKWGVLPVSVVVGADVESVVDIYR